MRPSTRIRTLDTRDAMPVMRGLSSSPVARGVGPSDLGCDLCYAACSLIDDPIARAACYAACQAIC